MDSLHKTLREKGLINEDQFKRLDAISSGNVISLYYELRLGLYLGILLFTGGVGYIVYQHMSDIGHIAIMVLLAILIVVGGIFIQRKAEPYSNTEVVIDHVYFDYVLVLVALLIISLFTYFQVYFELVEILIKWTSLISGVLFLAMAYRYDNKMVLAMGITAIAAVFGLTISPVDWAQGEWVEGVELYLLSVSLGVMLLVVGQFLHFQNIKKHFTFTFHNFGFLLLYFGALAIALDYDESVFAAVFLLFLTLLVAWYTWKKKFFLFFIYSCVTGYIALTYLFIYADATSEIMILYFPITIIGGVMLLIKKRNYFSDAE